MAARSPRRSFATPFVVTLAAAPACYVQTAPAPQAPPSEPPPSSGPPPSQPADPRPVPVVANPPRPQTAPEQQQPPQPPPVVVANPPPPTTQGPATPTPKPPVVVSNPPTTTQGPATPAQESRWTVYKANDGCMAAIKVECQPKATCNPPPPFKYACPDGVSLDKPVTVVTRDGSSCFVEYDMPTCPKGVACNPPRPKPVACPKR